MISNRQKMLKDIYNIDITKGTCICDREDLKKMGVAQQDNKYNYSWNKNNIAKLSDSHLVKLYNIVTKTVYHHTKNYVPPRKGCCK